MFALLIGYRNYLPLYHKITSEGYYWNSLIKNCVLCQTKNKYNKLPPPSNHILCDFPKELYVKNITEVPYIYKTHQEEKLYNLSIIDHCSKFSQNYIIKNKDQNTVLNYIEQFINEFGIPKKNFNRQGSSL